MNSKKDKFSLLLKGYAKSFFAKLSNHFDKNVYELYSAETTEKTFSIIKKNEIHLVLIDLNPYDANVFFLTQKIKKDFSHIKILITTENSNVEDAIKVFKSGAIDYIQKDDDQNKIVKIIHKLFKNWQSEKDNQKSQNKLKFDFKYKKMIGNSKKVLDLKQTISQIGLTDETVLIQGETGTGKELVAKAIHYHSERAKNAFVVVDCTTINKTTMDSELFGHIKGAFTGAYTDVKGLIKAAHQGSIFFDEIGELPLDIQAKLLRVLQEKEIRPVGANQPSKVDIRILAATNLDLKKETSKKTFRKDLFYRLDTLTINVPPLRERIDDVCILANHFIEIFQTDFSTIETISKETLRHMERHLWPGNIRELENLIRRVMTLSDNKIFLPKDLPETIYKKRDEKTSYLGEDSLKAYEKMAIANALKKCDDNRKCAAQLLQIGEATLYRKIKKYWPKKY